MEISTRTVAINSYRRPPGETKPTPPEADESFEKTAEAEPLWTLKSGLNFLANEGLPVIVLGGIGLSAGLGVAAAGVGMGAVLSFVCTP